MKRMFVAGFAIAALWMTIPIAAAAKNVGIPDIAWNGSSLDSLHSFNVDDVFEFVDQLQDDPNYLAIQTQLSSDSRCIEGFTWADLAGDNQYRLVVVFDPPGTSITNSVVIYSRSSSGKITTQVISGEGISLNGDTRTDTPKLLQDLDHDGKYELVVPEEWGSGLNTSFAEFPKVYRLSNGEYVEASRDFPTFYDKEILPKLEREISQAGNELVRNGPVPPELTTSSQINEWRSEPARKLASLEMERDKTLRVLGREPNAGEKEARKWVESGDWELVVDAISVFEDMGGHEVNLREAKQALSRTNDTSEEERAISPAPAPPPVATGNSIGTVH